MGNHQSSFVVRPSSLIERARTVLRDNLVFTASGQRYIRPAPMTSEQQWLWDSWFHAIVNTHLDAQLAMDEIAALLSHQLTDGDDAGMLPHMIYWQGGGRELWGRDDRSTITQPPVVAYAVERIYDATYDGAFVRRVYPALKAYHAWWLRRRDADVCIEVTGSYRALNDAIRATAYNSRLVVVGLFQGEGKGLFLGEELHHNRILLICAQISGVNPRLDHRSNRLRLNQTIMRLQEHRRIDLKGLISHVVPAHDAADAFRLLYTQPAAALQVVLKF